MNTRATPNKKTLTRAFTLVEVAVAIAILGLALTSLVTLQTRQLQSHFHEKKLMKAALYAQYLMAIVETKENPPEIGETSGDLRDALNTAGYFDDDRMKEEEKELDGWSYQQRVSEFQLPSVTVPIEDIARTIQIEVSWGRSAGDRFALSYLRKTDKSLKVTN